MPPGGKVAGLDDPLCAIVGCIIIGPLCAIVGCIIIGPLCALVGCTIIGPLCAIVGCIMIGWGILDCCAVFIPDCMPGAGLGSAEPIAPTAAAPMDCPPLTKPNMDCSLGTAVLSAHGSSLDGSVAAAMATS